MKLKKGIQFKDKVTGRIITIKNRKSGNKHWNCTSNGKKNHMIHEGTLLKYYERLE